MRRSVVVSPASIAAFPRMGPPIHNLLGIDAGETRYFRVWYRDPFGPCGQPFDTSNAVFVVWGI